MKLYKDDLIKFYELLKHYDETSPNIGIVADKKTFKKIIKEVLKKVDYDVLISNKESTKYTILIEDMEISYIHIESLGDLSNLYFSKYI